MKAGCGEGQTPCVCPGDVRRDSLVAPSCGQSGPAWHEARPGERRPPSEVRRDASVYAGSHSPAAASNTRPDTRVPLAVTSTGVRSRRHSWGRVSGLPLLSPASLPLPPLRRFCFGLPLLPPPPHHLDGMAESESRSAFHHDSGV